MTISVLGAGAFGTSLAIALARDGSNVTLFARDECIADKMQSTRATSNRLPGHTLPDTLAVTSDISLLRSEISLLAIPTQKLRAFLDANRPAAPNLIACCKGVDRQTGLGPVHTIEATCPGSNAAILTGPSFAVDIARGLPTALTLATRTDETAATLQTALTRPTLRLYRSSDVIGAELGGALKNVIALAAGMAMGAGLGDSARASVIARGFAEMTRFAVAKGALLETIQGLSGLGDLVLTCTSDKSRNYLVGQAFGKGQSPEPGLTVEGAGTAQAVAAAALEFDMDMPLTQAVSSVVTGDLDIQTAIQTLLSRPAGKE